MSDTKIPGIKGKHRWITDNRVAMKGINGAVDEAVEDARAFLLDCIPRWSGKHGVRFHVVVTVERPTEPQGEGE